MASSSLIESKCFICSALFDARSLPQHERECLENLQDNLTTITKEVDNLLEVEEEESVKSATSTGSSEGSATRKTVRCYICGSDFPTHFISLHEKQCKRKWESGVTNNDSLKKGSSLGNISTARENYQLPRSAYNAAGMKKAQSVANVSHREPKQAWNARLRDGESANDKAKSNDRKPKRSTSAKKKPRPMSAYASLSTQNLSSSYSAKNEVRIFDDTDGANGMKELKSADSLDTLTSLSDEKASRKPGTPRFTECKHCWNKFSVHSISIHEKKCRVRTGNDLLGNEKENKPTTKPMQNGRCVSVNELRFQNGDDDWLNGQNLSQSHTVSSDMLDMVSPSDVTSSGVLHKSRFFQCHICGKSFGSKSLPIHVRQCEKAKQLEIANNDNHKEKARLPRRKDQKRMYHSEINLHNTNNNNNMNNRKQSVGHTPIRKTSKQQGPERISDQKNGLRASSSDKKRTPTGNNYVCCHFCNNYYGSASIKIHEVKCGLKMEKTRDERTPKNSSQTPRKQSSTNRRLFDLQR